MFSNALVAESHFTDQHLRVGRNAHLLVVLTSTSALATESMAPICGCLARSGQSPSLQTPGRRGRPVLLRATQRQTSRNGIWSQIARSRSAIATIDGGSLATAPAVPAHRSRHFGPGQVHGLDIDLTVELYVALPFQVVLQKATELCGELAHQCRLLSALESDSETFRCFVVTPRSALLEAVQAVKENQVAETMRRATPCGSRRNWPRSAQPLPALVFRVHEPGRKLAWL
jgi:hypothetical protein